ncbi:MAG: hypothetical protein U5K69_08080 [Balneolaceae bacterium]|nr:hypothetical protein [Balneolaceae bacterium]
MGGAAQLPFYRHVSKDLKLTYTQFQELEIFSRFSARMDESSRKIIERGRRLREVMKQPQYQPMSPVKQVAELLAVNEGYLDELEMSQISEAKQLIHTAVEEQLESIGKKIERGEHLKDEERHHFLSVIETVLEPLTASQKEKLEAEYANGLSQSNAKLRARKTCFPS